MASKGSSVRASLISKRRKEWPREIRLRKGRRRAFPYDYLQDLRKELLGRASMFAHSLTRLANGSSRAKRFSRPYRTLSMDL